MANKRDTPSIQPVSTAFLNGEETDRLKGKLGDDSDKTDDEVINTPANQENDHTSLDEFPNTEEKITEGGTRDIQGERKDTDGEMRDIQGETRDTEGEMRNIQGETRDTEGEMRNIQGETRDTEGDLGSPAASSSVSLDSNLRDFEGDNSPENFGNDSNEPDSANSMDVESKLPENRAKCVLISPEQVQRSLQDSTVSEDTGYKTSVVTSQQQESAACRHVSSGDKESSKENANENLGGMETRAESSRRHDDVENVSRAEKTADVVPSLAVHVDLKSSSSEEKVLPSLLCDNATDAMNAERKRNQIARLPSPKPGLSGPVKACTGNMLSRGRIPPKLIRLATVTVATRTRTPNKGSNRGPSLYYQEPFRRQKVITWDAANNARPPLRIDMEGPGPCSYSPRNKPLNETNAPSFTFGSKCYSEKDGGSRTSWEKSWFQTPHVWTNKTDFSSDGPWPAPPTYRQPRLLGSRQKTATEAPSYTFGRKCTQFCLSKPGSEKEPSPMEYDRHLADHLILTRQPSYSHQFRVNGTVLWGSREKTPGPAAYSPKISRCRFRTAFTIQGTRREKSQQLGPFSTF